MTVQMEHVSQLVLASSALYGAAVGASLGAVYDLFRALRIAAGLTLRRCFAYRGRTLPTWGRRLSAALLFISDVLFSLIASAALSVTVFHLLSGHIRWFILLGTGLGFLLYRRTVGRLTARIMPRIIRAVGRFVLAAARLTLLPLLRLLRLLFRLLSCPPAALLRRLDIAPRAQVCHACRALRSRCCAVFGADGKRRRKRSGTAALLIAYLFRITDISSPAAVCFRGCFAFCRAPHSRQCTAFSLFHDAIHRQRCAFSKKISLCGRFMPQNVIQW